MTTATQFKVKGYSSASTVTTYKAAASISFNDDFRAQIFNTEYVIECVEYTAKWTGSFRKSDVVIRISFCTILADGKKGKKFNFREFELSNIALYTNLPADMLSALETQLGAEVVKAAA